MSDKYNKKRIGIWGFGCVGQGLYDVLQHNRHTALEVASICVKHPEKKRTLPASMFTFNPQQLLEDASIDLLTELISDPEEAYLLVKQALLAGKSVISANKKMIAQHLPELIELQQKYGGRLLYEAAVGGSIPILRTLEAYYGNEPLQEVCGILNGSSNYILSKLHEEEISYQDALQEAQELGFAETDPRLDVGGHDALHKICIIAAHGFGALVDPAKVVRLGIEHINTNDVKLAQALGTRIKLVATARLTASGKLAVQVLPAFVKPTSELYFVEAEFNGVLLEAKFAGTQFLKGRGAGSHPTGSAVWADVSAALGGYKYNYAKIKQQHLSIDTEGLITIYLRTALEGELPKLPWLEVTSFGVNSKVIQLVGTLRYTDLLLHQRDLEKAGAFIVEVPQSLDSNDFIRASKLQELEIVN
ncbi:homoserine dehydrogenase [Pontibacter arcticus]|uniref:Homoserine dehydrogenase n=1 Tax=Pontibacter arcticus TaxID=2080288 RepID=A0A364REC1_9BACT|nr:homoserine dehydrogenase [Pontibacter arcticus]RAU82595.1 homoserine dehydrogenase [Pontibacter arcticus]